MIAIIRNAACAALFALLAGPAAAGAQDYQQDYPDTYGDSDIRQTVARLSYIYGNVAFSRGDEPDDWQPADPNIPMTLGDRVWTANGRLELQIHGGNVVRLAKSTSLAALNLTEDTKQFSLSAGIATFKIRRLDDYEVFEVDTPNAAVTFETPGEYRIDVRGDGYTRIQVRRGQATVASGGGQVPLGAGDAILLEGYETPRYDFVSIRLDSWDRWVSSRDTQYARVRSYEYVSPSIAGVEDLDGYGQWQSLPSYGWSWTPSAVATGWAPYRAGRWMWQDPWGWTWVSTERWGWAPYHYGRWVHVQSRWYWVPGSPQVVVPYRPALVAFVGGGPGFSVSVGVGTDYIGWFPLAPREPFIPWWGRPAVNVNINVTNITYVNRTYVTVVNERTFVGGQAVATNYVRDRAIINRVERAPVLAGPIPVYPTRASLRTSTRATTAPRPPAAVVSRPVVARLAPPPAPPRFEEKEAVIRQNRGAPVNPAEAHRLSQQRDQLRPPVPVRPVVREPGRVELAPRNQTAKTVQPQPVTAPRGRELATRERPVAPEPAPQPERRRQAPATAPASAPTPDRDPRDRTVQQPVSRERVTPQQESESQQRQQQQRETVQRETQQREAEQQKQREADQREVQQRQLQQQQQQQQRETAQRETQQREAAQQKQREADQRQLQQQQQQQQQQRETAQREAQQRRLQEQQQQQETAQRETQQREAASQRVTAPSSESAPRRGPAPTAVPSERVQPAPQTKERAQPAERVSPQPKAQRPQNPPEEPEARPTPSRQRGRVTPKPTPTARPGG